MKKTKPIAVMAAIAVLLLCSMQAHAKIWRVNNRSNYNGTTLWGNNFGGTAGFPVFNQINQAVAFASVVNSDTLHIEGSPDVYNSATITKKLVLIGPGFYFGDNPKTSSDGYEAQVQRIEFDAGSSQSTVIGLDIVLNGNNADGYIYLVADSITIKRCRMVYGVTFSGYGLFTLATIVENFFSDTSNSVNANALNADNIYFVPPGDLIFNNNICQKTLVWGNSLITSGGITLWSITECKNNVFAGPDNFATNSLAFTTTDFSNNILTAVNAFVDISAPAGQIAYNIGTQSTQFGTANNNLVVPAITTLFVGGASHDGYYQIQSGTQAYQSGSDGTDRGAFGGTILSSRYTLSGLAPIPVVYQTETTGEVLSGGLAVKISARTIK